MIGEPVTTLRRLVSLSLCCLCVLACAGTQSSEQLAPTGEVVQQERQFVIEDAGHICFDRYVEVEGRLEGFFRPAGCYSSSCTEVLESEVETEVDAQSYVISLKTRFVLLDTTVMSPEPQLCTMDCQGGGEERVVFTGLMNPSYSVWLGAKELGDLIMADIDENDDPVCLGEW